VTEASPRQVLYALVAAGFLIIVVILTIGGAVAGLVPTWWSVTLGLTVVGVSAWMAVSWRRTALMLGLAIAEFVMWLIGTVILAT
jgi:hypothetical protein